VLSLSPIVDCEVEWPRACKPRYEVTLIPKRFLVAVIMAVGLCSAGHSYSGRHPGPGAAVHEAERHLTAEWVRTFKNYHRGSFSPDGKLLGLQSKRYFDLIEAGTGKQIRRIEPSCDEIMSCEMSPDGALVALSYMRLVSKQPVTIEDWLTLYDLKTGRAVAELAHDPRGSYWGSVSFSPDGKLLASTVGGVVRTYDLSTNKEVRTYWPPASSEDIVPHRVLFSPDSKWLAVYFHLWHSCAIHLWNVASGEEKVLRPEAPEIKAWAFSSDSTKLAMVDTVGAANRRAITKTFDVETLKLLGLIYSEMPWGAQSLAFSANGELVAMGGLKAVRLISLRSGDDVGEIEFFGHGLRFQSYASVLYELVTPIQFSPDSREILAGIGGGQVRLWRIQEQ
jgi:WD40 repeat protein